LQVVKKYEKYYINETQQVKRGEKNNSTKLTMRVNVNILETYKYDKKCDGKCFYLNYNKLYNELLEFFFILLMSIIKVIINI